MAKEVEMSFWGRHPILYMKYSGFLRKGTCWECRRKFNLAVKGLVEKRVMVGFEDVGFGFDQLCEKCQGSRVVLQIMDVYNKEVKDGE